MTDVERRAIISGIGQSAVGRKLGRSELDLTIDASLAAVADAGLTLAEIDGLASYPGGGMAAPGGFAGPGTPTVQDALRLSLNWHSGGPEGPAQIQAVINAVMAVAAGLARHVLVYRTVTESTAQGGGGRKGIGMGAPGDGIGGGMQWSLPFRAYSASTGSRSTRNGTSTSTARPVSSSPWSPSTPAGMRAPTRRPSSVTP